MPSTADPLTDARWPEGIPAAGQCIAGKYRVEGIIGRGGMGAVVAAVHLDLGQRFAIKIMLPKAATHHSASARILREAKAASAIHSEHGVRIYDVGKLDSGAAFLVMEYLVGQPLSEIVQQRGALSICEAIDFVMQACEAITEAHAMGLVHRDLKPSNMFLAERLDGTKIIKVLDFGISKAEWLRADPDFAPDLTATTDVMGTPLYMSPEQVRSSKHVDVRTDIWALGVVLYELITGTPPFWADSLPALVAMIVADSPPPPQASRPDIPAQLQAIILACLEKDPDARPPTVQDLACALAPFGSEASAASCQRIAKLATKPQQPLRLRKEGTELGPGAETAHAWGTTHLPMRRRPGAIALVAGGVAGLVATLGLVWIVRTRPSNATAQPSPTPSEQGTPIAIPPQPSTSVVVAPSAEPPTSGASSAPAAPKGKRPPRTGGRGVGPLDDRY